MSGYSTIKRGRMAGDAFTQIANQVFRDDRLTAKAMGVFGHLSTHRDGYGVTPERIAHFMRDGVDAIKSALRELEKFGYLYRERERRPDGTLGCVTYFITDQPEPQPESAEDPGTPAEDAPGRNVAVARPRSRDTRRSAPEGDFPPQDRPPLADPTPKNTKNKKTNNSENTTVPPSVPRARATTARASNGRTDGHPASIYRPQPAPRRRAETVARTPGIQLLQQIGAEDPRYLLTGPTLQDQGVAVTALLTAGWTEQQIRQVITGRPLPEKITTSIGAIVANRLGTALASPAPADAALQAQPGPWPGAADATWTPPPVSHVLHAVSVQAECNGDDGLCGRPTAPGYDKCPACLQRSAPDSQRGASPVPSTASVGGHR